MEDDFEIRDDSPITAESHDDQGMELGTRNDNDSIIDEDFIIEDDEEGGPESEKNEDLHARNGRRWSRQPRQQFTGRFSNRNVFRQNRGFRIGLHPRSRMEGFQVLFQNTMPDIVRFINLRGRRICHSMGVEWKKTDETEVMAFIGLYMLSGVYKAYHRNARELWSDRDGQPVFKATMSYERFSQLKGALRFDDPARRNREDKLSPIRHFIDAFNVRLSELYYPGPHLCIDEMLIEYFMAVFCSSKIYQRNRENLESRCFGLLTPKIRCLFGALSMLEQALFLIKNLQIALTK